MGEKLNTPNEPVRIDRGTTRVELRERIKNNLWTGVQGIFVINFEVVT